MKPIKIQPLFSEKDFNIEFPQMPEIYICAGFYKMNGYDGYWSVFKESFENKEQAEKYCKSKTRNGWLCFKIFKLK